MLKLKTKKIMQTTGTGAQQQKVCHIQRLFVASESRYICRHMQSNYSSALARW